VARDESRRQQRHVVPSGWSILSQSGPVDWSDDNADDDASARAGYQPESIDGIKRFRWARSVDHVHRVLGNDRADELGAVPFLNSWGRGYPHRTWLPDDVLERLMQEGWGGRDPDRSLTVGPSERDPERPQGIERRRPAGCGWSARRWRTSA
jgi:hypothetical protein